MKTKLIASILLCSFTTAALMYGCKKKEENQTVTSTNGDYAGTWTVNETCSSAWSYQMTAAATGTNGVTLTNFHKGTFANGFTINATVNDKTLTIASQTATSSAQGGPYTFSGSGTFTPPGTMTINYTMAQGATSLTCSSNCTK